jgi:RNA polymerase sigma-70 factor (ECF subfamily)
MTTKLARIAFPSLTSLAGNIGEAFVPPMPAAYLPPANPATNPGISLARLRLLSDEQLAEALQEGGADALTILFERHSPQMFRIARRILRHDAEAEDTVQTVFLDVYRAIAQFNPAKGRFKSWLFLFAYQRCFNRRRGLLASRFFDTDSLDAMAELTGELSRSGQFAAHLSDCEGNILIEQLMSTLKPNQRRTIELIYYQGYTADEVAQRTGETVRVVRHNLYRGLDKLRKQLLENADSNARLGHGGSQ